MNIVQHDAAKHAPGINFLNERFVSEMYLYAIASTKVSKNGDKTRMSFAERILYLVSKFIKTVVIIRR